jgi:multimeric flavodoxin WrbA
VTRLLVVHHTPSPGMAELLDAVLRGARDPEITGVEVVRRAALGATASDLLAADAVLLGTPANIGYMSGALKHFFDTVYYPCADDTRGLPYGVWVHGNQGLDGAVAAVTSIADGLGWRAAAAPVEVTGQPDRAALDACAELGGVLAATISPDL